MVRLAGLAVAWCLCAVIVPTTSVSARSIGVQPLLVEVTPGQNAAIRVRNSGEESTTVDVVVAERIIDGNGVQQRVPADDRFVIFPPQSTIAGDATQVFRIQPIEAGLTASKSYFITVQQVPVAYIPRPGSDGGAQIQVLFAFDVAVHVVPRGAKPVMEFISATPAQTTITLPNPEANIADASEPVQPPIRKTVPGVAISLRNTGNKFLYLQDYEFLISGTDAAGAKIELPAPGVKDVIDAAGVTLVPPAASREFTLPLAEASTLRDIAVRVRPRARG